MFCCNVLDISTFPIDRTLNQIAMLLTIYVDYKNVFNIQQKDENAFDYAS